MNRLAAFILLLAVLALVGGCPGAGSSDVTDPHAGHNHKEGVAAHAADESADVDPGSLEEHDLGMKTERHDMEEGDEHAGHGHEPADPHSEEEHPGEIEDQHAGHGNGNGDDTDGIRLSAEQVRELGIRSATAGPASLGRELKLTGEVAINEDKVTHVAPRISGIISRVHHTLGDHVAAGSPLLELDSIELAQAKGDYLAALDRGELARQTLEREEMLLEKGISAEQEYLAAKQVHDAEQIGIRTLQLKLRAMGLSEAQIDSIDDDPLADMTGYTVYSPVSGEIIEKHAALGELTGPGSEVFTIGDLSTVWVRLDIYQQDFLDVKEGMLVLVDPGHGIEPVSGSIDYIEPLIGEETRTAVARVMLRRSSHLLRPGLFVTGYLEVDGEPADVVVPRNAVVDLDQDKLVFVRSGLTFIPREVSIGRQTATSIEILDGLEPGDNVVVEGAFQLKAELLKGSFDPHAGHAH